MKAKQRVEKIWECRGDWWVKKDKFISEIAAQIEEAEREAKHEERASVGQYGREQYYDGFCAARDQAAGIAETWCNEPKSGPCGDELIENLRKMEPSKCPTNS